ncbi:ABC-2 transporter permease [Kyrpidia sp.]|uniref:ABC-2 transporter permease n=1 Tax=Kyrpidia sp. TaxID=2073077 RepID=UPI0025876BE1|nr:ABC-2 transporter permease [Kyrpidia sp.]MCL6576748.1 ABC-2 transporter permease [Kyrpidia sp.]
MRSLFIKDWIVYRKPLVVHALLLVVISTVLRNPTASSIMIAMWTVIILSQAIQIDFRGESDILVNSLPVSRSAIVRARYLEMVFIGPAMFFLVELVSAVLRSLNLFEFPAMGWTHLGGVLSVSILWSALILPLYYGLGPVFVRYLGVVIFVISAGIGAVAGAVHSWVKHDNSEWIVAIWTWIQNLVAGDGLAWVWLLLGTASIYVASLMFSVRLYQRREF